MPIEPTQQQMTAIAAAAGGENDGPVVLLNLHRYREVAAYDEDPPGGGPREVSGHDAYSRYGEAALPVLERVGGRILWYSQSPMTVIGDDGDRYDEVIGVWYPSRSAFVALATAPEILRALPHRLAGLESAALICCDAGPLGAFVGA